MLRDIQDTFLIIITDENTIILHIELVPKLKIVSLYFKF